MDTLMWGVYQTVSGVVHVAPCDSEGVIMSGHITASNCPCNPAKDEENMWVHEVIQ